MSKTSEIRIVRGHKTKSEPDSSLANRLQDALDAWPFETGMNVVDYVEIPVPRRIRVKIG